jgi:hypothetical protein
MTLTFNRTAYALLILSFAFIFLFMQRTDRSMVAASSAVMLPQAAPSPTPPTNPNYNCGDQDSPDPISFTWTRRMPNNGWLGTVTYGNFVNKPIQVFDAKVDPKYNNGRGLTDWAFQAQDGSFLCRMKVTPNVLRRNVWFESCKNNNWPQLFCSIR